MVLVDSCIWIEAAKKTGDLLVKNALQALLEEYEATFCGPVKLEVIGAVQPQRRKQMEALFSTVPYLISTDLIWEESKQRAWQLRDRGIVTPWFDVVIATMAILNECRLYTADTHFHAMATCLPLRLYRPGYSGGFMED